MKNLFRVALIFCLILISESVLKAQQDAEFTQYMFNGLVLNPAYSGTRDAISAVAIGRYQWVDVDGAPKTISASLHGPLSEKVGLGIMAEYDQIGVHDRTRIFASYSYKFLVGANGRLSAGIQGGVANLASAWTELNPEQLNDPRFNEDESRWLPNFGVGLYYYTPRFYLGFSVPHLLNNKLTADDEDPGLARLAKENRHYYLTSGIVLPLSPDFKLKPSVLFKSVPAVAPLEVDLHLALIIKNVFTIGATYRSLDSFDLLANFQLSNNLRIGYAYDLTVTELKNYTSGSHEVMLGLDFGFSKERVVTPRFF